MFKKSFLLTFALVFSFLIPALPVTKAYEDVPKESPYFYSIDYLRRNGVFQEAKFFYPNNLIYKAEFIKSLVVLNSPKFVPTWPAALPFEDTDNNAWYAPYFDEAIDLGILDERDTHVGPFERLTVADALTLLFHSQSIPIPNVYKGNIPYTDISPDSPNAALFMKASMWDMVKPARDDYFGIYRRVTRAEAARMIYRLDLVALGGSQDIPSDTPQGAFPPELQKIITVWQQIETGFLYEENFDKNKVTDAALKAMVEALGDKYSVYMNQEANKNFNDSLNGNLEGIGAVLGLNAEKEVSIMSTIPDGPAAKAGLMAKDVILEVNGESLVGKIAEDAVPLIKGPAGTTVHLKIRRSGAVFDYAIKREVIVIKAATLELLESGTIYHLKLTQFGSTAHEELQAFLTQFKNDAQAKGIILDLRNNPGGLLDASVRILGHFVEPKKELVKINYKDYHQVLISKGDAELKGVPLVLLINGASASASEIVAGALKDYELATLVGETTFGKGSVQKMNIFGDKSSLKLTVAKWLTPLGANINEEGVEPHVLVTDDEATPVDEQLQTALQELKKKL